MESIILYFLHIFVKEKEQKIYLKIYWLWFLFESGKPSYQRSKEQDCTLHPAIDISSYFSLGTIFELCLASKRNFAY